MNLVKTKVAFSKMQSGQILGLVLDNGPPINNVPRSVIREGHEIMFPRSTTKGQKVNNRKANKVFGEHGDSLLEAPFGVTKELPPQRYHGDARRKRSLRILLDFLLGTHGHHRIHPPGLLGRDPGR